MQKIFTHTLSQHALDARSSESLPWSSVSHSLIYQMDTPGDPYPPRAWRRMIKQACADAGLTPVDAARLANDRQPVRGGSKAIADYFGWPDDAPIRGIMQAAEESSLASGDKRRAAQEAARLRREGGGPSAESGGEVPFAERVAGAPSRPRGGR